MGTHALTKTEQHAPVAAGARTVELVRDDEDPAPVSWEWVLHLERLSQAGFVTAGVAHGAVDALTAITGTCQLALMTNDLQKAHEALARVNQMAMRAADDMSVFLTFARWSPHGSAPVRFAFVLDDALRFVRAAVQATRAQVDVYAEEELWVDCDRTLLLQALVDVLVFCMRTVGRLGARICVTARRDGEAVSIVVADDGEGLAAQIAASAFAPIVEPHETRALGLDRPLPGLFLARRILEEQRGSLTFGAGERHGTEFRIQVPAARGEQSAAGSTAEGTTIGITKRSES
jgi:C4-dicarboxylate-specific signal transduction histidine kinase